MPLISDEEVVTALKENVEVGFRMLMAMYKERVYWHIRRLVVSHDDALDATQETFLRVFRSIDSFKGRSSFSVWIYRIATNEAMRILECRKNETISLDGVDMMADEYIDYTDIEAVRLQKAILLLPTKQQLAFNLRYYDELEYDEIARITNSTAVNVKANYHLAKEKIIKYLKSNE